MLGIGVGWVAEEAEAVGTDFSTRGARTDESIAAMRALWQDTPTASFSGPTVQFNRVVSRPNPINAAGVPIIVGGHSPAAARRAGRFGDGFYPLGVFGPALDDLLDLMRETARSVDRDPSQIEVTTAASLNPGLIDTLATQGIGRVLVSPPTGDLEALPKALESFQKNVMEAHPGP